MIKELEEKEIPQRCSNRVYMRVPVTLEYPEGSSVVTRDGNIFDFSKTGMSFYTATPLQKGINLNVYCDHLWDLPRASTVEWCSMKDLRCYKIGVSFETI